MRKLKLDEFNDIEIMNLVVTLVTDHANFIKCWSEMMFSRELAIPDEIKNRIFTIWFVATQDLIEEEQNLYLPLLGQASSRNLKNTQEVLYQFGNLVESAKRIIRQFTENEQLIIRHLRNTYCHGVANRVHLKRASFKVLKKTNDRLKNVPGFNSEKFWELFRSETHGSIDEYLTPLRIRFFKKNTEYYRNAVRISDTGATHAWIDWIYKDRQTDE